MKNETSRFNKPIQGGQPKIVVNGMIIQKGSPIFVPEPIIEPIIVESDFVEPITVSTESRKGLLSKLRSFFGWPIH